MNGASRWLEASAVQAIAAAAVPARIREWMGIFIGVPLDGEGLGLISDKYESRREVDAPEGVGDASKRRARAGLGESPDRLSANRFIREAQADGLSIGGKTSEPIALHSCSATGPPCIRGARANV
jgi:hypothetical protein